MKGSIGLRLSPRIPVLVAVQRFLGSGSALFFGGFMLANVISYAYQMLVSRMLSPADYGVIVALISIYDVLAVLLRAFQAWVIEAVATPEDAGARHPGDVFTEAMRTLAPMSGVAFVAHWLGSFWLAGFLHLDTSTPIIMLGAYVSSSLLGSITYGLTLGLNRLRLACFMLLAESIVRLIMGVALVAMGLGVSGAMAAFSVGNFVCSGIAVVALWPVLAARRGSAIRADGPAALDRFALLALVTNTCLMAIVSVDQLVVKHFLSEEVAGNYAIAFLLGRIILMSTIALGWVIFARSATMPLNDPRRRWLMIKGLLVTGFIAVTLTSGYLAMPGHVVQLLGGSRYSLAGAYVGLMGIEMTLFAFVYVQVYYQIAAKNAQVVWPLVLATLVELALLAQFHATVAQIQMTIIAVMGGLLIWVSTLSWRHFR